jgi:hypothetical protein
MEEAVGCDEGIVKGKVKVKGSDRYIAYPPPTSRRH